MIAEYHPELFPIYKKGKTWDSTFRRGFRLYTKQQLCYVVAGGTSIHTQVHVNHFQIIRKNRKDYLQVSKIWYERNRSTFEQCMTFDDQIKQTINDTKTKPLDSFFQE